MKLQVKNSVVVNSKDKSNVSSFDYYNIIDLLCFNLITISEMNQGPCFEN
jgi:hypothetical protein